MPDRVFSTEGRAASDLLRRLVVLGGLPRLRLRLIDRLDEAAFAAARTDRRAATHAGSSDRRQHLGLLRPGGPLLRRSLRILRWREAVALALALADADRLARARVAAVDHEREIARLSQRRCRHGGRAD